MNASYYRIEYNLENRASLRLFEQVRTTEACIYIKEIPNNNNNDLMKYTKQKRISKKGVKTPFAHDTREKALESYLARNNARYNYLIESVTEMDNRMSEFDELSDKLNKM